MGKRGRTEPPPVRSHSWEIPAGSVSKASWEGGDGERYQQEQFGEMLQEILLTNYARGKLTAKSLCQICFFAVQAGALGHGIHKLALEPTGNTGNYQAHLDRVLPQHSAVELCDVLAPMHLNGIRKDPRGPNHK